MNLFFGTASADNTAFLSPEESSHCIRVFRMKKGDEIDFTDGKGTLFKGVIEIADPENCRIQILHAERSGSRRNYRLHVAIAPTKNIDRFEFFLEKATEIGIDEVTPLVCQRSERREVKTARLEKVIMAAMKQSHKTWLPAINNAMPFEKFITGASADARLICTQQAKEHLADQARSKKSILLLIGPEGDFTEKELLAAENTGYIQTALGQSRLRTETAGIVACSVVSLLNENEI